MEEKVQKVASVIGWSYNVFPELVARKLGICIIDNDVMTITCKRMVRVLIN